MPDWSLVLAGMAAALPALLALQAGRARLGFALVVAAAAVAMFVSDVAALGIVIAVLTGLSLELPRPTAGRRAVVMPHRVIASYASVAALLLASVDLPNDPGTALTVAAIIGMAAAAGTGWVAALRLGAVFVWVMVAAGAVAIYTAVPDTEQITVVATALTVAALVVVAVPAAVPGVFSVAVAAALVVWATAAGSGGRPAAFVSAAGALAGIAVLTLAWGSRPAPPLRSREAATLIAISAATAIVVARTGGIADDVAPAIAMTAAGIAVGSAALWLVAGRAVGSSSRSSE